MTDAETERFHHQAHGQTTMKFGGELLVYTCRTTNSQSCTVGISNRGSGGISVTLSLDAAEARQLAQVLLAAAEMAERVDAETREVAP